MPEDPIIKSVEPETDTHVQPTDAATVSVEGSDAPSSVPNTFPTIPGFEIISELGRGGMGVVYQARQVGLNRTVALKMVLAGSLAGRSTLERFLKEAEAAARLQHPNVANVYHIGRWQPPSGGPELPFFAMEYCPNGSLSESGKKQWDPREAAQLVATLAGAVSHAHAQQVVHRDLKPANILFAADGSPKIADFGLAKRLDAEPLTNSHAVMGSPGFMAPEQASGGSKRVGPAADVYGLGAILYHLLTGRAPFKGSDHLEVLLQVAQQPPTPLRKLRPEIPAALEAVCLKCLEKEPERRYASAAGLKDDLDRFLAGKEVAAKSTRRMNVTYRRLEWHVLHFFVIIVILYGLWHLNNRETVVASWLFERLTTESPSPLIREFFLPLCFLLLYAAGWFFRWGWIELKRNDVRSESDDN